MSFWTWGDSLWNSIEVLKLTSRERFGINTTSPIELSDVNGNIKCSGNISCSGTTLTVGNSSGATSIYLTDLVDAAWQLATGGYNLNFNNNNNGGNYTSKVTFTNTGRVEINATSPTEILDVNGNIKCSGK
jgi:hypothetical protein